MPNNDSIKVSPNLDKRVVVLVTKERHCISYILVLNHYQTLGEKVDCVIGNHPNLKDLCDRFDMPFYQIISTKNQRIF